MAWYWELPICWECTQCGTISYGTRRWLWKTPPKTCPHCGRQSFTGIGVHNRPLSWSLPARGSRVQQYTQAFGWYVTGSAILSGMLAVLLDNTRHLAVVSPSAQRRILLGILVVGLVLGSLIRRGVKSAWIAAAVGVIGGVAIGIWYFETAAMWELVAWICWWVAGVALAWKSAYVLRHNPRA